MPEAAGTQAPEDPVRPYLPKAEGRGKGPSPPRGTCLRSKGLAAGNLRRAWGCPWGRLCSPAPRPQKGQQPSHAPVGGGKNTPSQFRTDRDAGEAGLGAALAPSHRGPPPHTRFTPAAKRGVPAARRTHRTGAIPATPCGIRSTGKPVNGAGEGALVKEELMGGKEAQGNFGGDRARGLGG